MLPGAQELGWVVLLPSWPSSWGLSLADPPSSSQALHSPARQAHPIWLLKSRGSGRLSNVPRARGDAEIGAQVPGSPRGSRLPLLSPRGELPATPGGPRGQCAGRSGDVPRRASSAAARIPRLQRPPAPGSARPPPPPGPRYPDPSPPAGRPHGPAGCAAPGRRPRCAAQLRAPGRRGRQRLLVHPGGGGRRQWQRRARARRAALLALGALARLRR